MVLVTVLSLFGYIASLAVSLTWYGADLMNFRWLTLFIVVITSASYWTLARQGKLSRWEKRDNILVLTYLILTFTTVIAAENLLFSGLRWASHGLMIITLLILLKNSLTAERTVDILLFVKAVIAALLLVSWLKPLSPLAILGGGVEAYKGTFGSSNALGQVAAVGAILYLHGVFTDKAKWMCMSQGGMLGLAVWLMWLTGSRSALVAFLTGLTMMYYFYPKLVRGKVVVVVLLAALLMMAFPWVPGKIQQTVLRSSEPVHSLSEQLLRTRKSVWASAWSGFQRRPLFGWGFGATSDIPKEWTVELKALGTVTRDAVNDTLFALEGTGVVGLGAYALLVIFALRQIPTRRERHLLGRIYSRSRLKSFDLSVYHLHAITFIVAASLLLMVQFDNTALSAGNFVSVTLWLCVTLAGTVRSKVMTDEVADQRRQRLIQYQTGASEAPGWAKEAKQFSPRK